MYHSFRTKVMTVCFLLLLFSGTFHINKFDPWYKHNKSIISNNNSLLVLHCDVFRDTPLSYIRVISLFFQFQSRTIMTVASKEVSCNCLNCITPYQDDRKMAKEFHIIKLGISSDIATLNTFSDYAEFKSFPNSSLAKSLSWAIWF